jgi:hypothetical protein
MREKDKIGSGLPGSFQRSARLRHQPIGQGGDVRIRARPERLHLGEEPRIGAAEEKAQDGRLMFRLLGLFKRRQKRPEIDLGGFV